MNRRTLPAVTPLALLSICFLNGCGPSGPKRHEVTGQVIFDGAPVHDGVIQFIPQDGQGSSDGASILNGEYRIPKEKGLFPGKYKVVIIAGDGSSGAGDAGVRVPGNAGPGVKPRLERVPPEWNTHTKQIVEVTEEGPNKFDFDIPRRKS